jgi:hypothetical protein
MAEITEVLLEGRVVAGHPLRRNGVTKYDDATRQDVPVKDPTTGLQFTEAYLAVAIPKHGEADWKQTAWGQTIANTAARDWPNGEHEAPTFAWKITDGDSTVPNRVGKVPCQREGWAGHWVAHLTTRFPIQCYHVGHYHPMQQIQDENAIKTGDYCRVAVGVKGNGPSQSPGVYLNPRLFELSRAGDPILSESGPAAATVFGGGAPTAPVPQVPPHPAAPTAPVPQVPPHPAAPTAPVPQVQPHPAAPTAPVPQVQPHQGFLNPQAPAAPTAPTAPLERTVVIGGQSYTEAALLAAGWTPQQIDAQADDIPF